MENESFDSHASLWDANIQLAENLYTLIDSIPANDSMVTYGLAYTGYYPPDSAGNDTTALGSLDSYIGQDVIVDLFFLGTAKDSMLVYVDQAYMWTTEAGDSAGATSAKFNYGLMRTDTLGSDTIAIPAVSGSGDPKRHFRYSFELQGNMIQLTFKNMAAQDVFDTYIHIMLYFRNSNYLMPAGNRLKQSVKDRR